MNKVLSAAILLALGAGAGVLGSQYLGKHTGSGPAEAAADEPLYWVAPMDPNYKRDQPGLSPMGMDLVPVYAEDLAGGASPGTVEIDPVVEQNLGVRTSELRFDLLREDVRALGSVSLAEDQIWHAHSRVSGWVRQLNINTVGEQVEAGAPLYSLYSPELVNALEEYRAAVRSGNRTLIRAATNKARALSISTDQLEEVRRTGVVPEEVTVYAPQAGVVSELNIREGMFVQPAQTLLSLGKLDKVWVEAEVFERQAAWLRQGAQVEVTMDYLPGQTFSGTLDYIYPLLDAGTRAVKARVVLNNPEQQLKPGMFAQVNIEARSAAPVLQMPAEALIRTGNQSRAVIALGEGKFKSVEVTAGARGGDWVEVKTGLMPTDTVVTSAQFLLDSESSISSDFIRMAADSTETRTAWVAGRVISIDHNTHTLELQHAAIPEWDQPMMVMPAQVDPTMSLENLQPEQVLWFLFEEKPGAMGEREVTIKAAYQPEGFVETAGGEL